MTQYQQTQYEKALARATVKEVHVVGHGTIKATGQKFIAVSSASGDGCYTVIIAGYSLICSCPAGKAGRYCHHRAVARHEIMERTAAADAAYVQQGVAIMAAAMDAADAERAAAIPMRRDTGPRMYA